MYTQGHTVDDVRRLPLNLLDALRAFEVSPNCAPRWARIFRARTVALKTQEWHEFGRQLTAWERETTLDC